MPKTTSEKKTCDRCNFEHPITWFKPHKLKDGTKTRSTHCKICRDSKGSLPSIETWNEQISKEVSSEKNPKEKSQPPPVKLNPLRRTIRFRYYGANEDLWQNLRSLLLTTKPSPKRTFFLESWAKKCDLNHLPHSESVIGSSKIAHKDLRLNDTRDPQDLRDIIITNINAGDDYSDPYAKEWSTTELGHVIKAFKDAIPFDGHVEGVLEIHFE